MSYPRDYFVTTPGDELRGTCFVLMPFAADLQNVYDTIRQALEDPAVGFTVRRADELFGGDQVMTGVLREIARAHVVIADLTDRNPNVFYELGITHMRKEPDRVLLISQRMEDVPFDLRAYRCILYTPDQDGLTALRKRISRSIREIGGPSYQFAVEATGDHRTPPEFHALDRCLYSVQVSEPMLARRFAKFRLRIWRHAVGEAPLVVLDDGFGLKNGESRQLPGLPWTIRLNAVEESAASFSIVPDSDSARTSRQRHDGSLNYEAEDKRNEWRIYEAAFLWNDLEPPGVEAHGQKMTRDVEETKNMLHQAVDRGDLSIVREVRSGDGLTRWVSRADLTAYALTLGRKPRFLFPDAR